MRILEVFADVCCPFTHVGLRRVVEARDAQGADLVLRVRAWPLEWVNGRPLDPRHVAAEVRDLRAQVAPDLFGGFSAERFPTTSIPAFGLAAAARARSDAAGEIASLALRHALFEEGRDLSDAAVLADLARELGVDAPGAADTEQLVREDLEEGRARGVVGSPHFFVGRTADWFCPGLDIERRDDGSFHIEVDRGALDDFLATVFGP